MVAWWMLQDKSEAVKYAIMEQAGGLTRSKQSGKLYVRGVIIGETEKAWKVLFSTNYGDISYWFAKSQCIVITRDVEIIEHKED